MKTKKGLSTIVATLVIILLVLVAVGIIWVVVRKIIEEEYVENETIICEHTFLEEGLYSVIFTQFGCEFELIENEEDNKIFVKDNVHCRYNSDCLDGWACGGDPDFGGECIFIECRTDLMEKCKDGSSVILKKCVGWTYYQPSNPKYCEEVLK